MKDKKTIILSLLHELQEIDNEFPLQYAICLCEIALEEGISLTTLSLRARMPLSTVSRIVGALSCNRQKGKPFGLVKVSVSETERRKKQLYLTQKGRETLSRLSTAIEDTAP